MARTRILAEAEQRRAVIEAEGKARAIVLRLEVEVRQPFLSNAASGSPLTALVAPLHACVTREAIE